MEVRGLDGGDCRSQREHRCWVARETTHKTRCEEEERVGAGFSVSSDGRASCKVPVKVGGVGIPMSFDSAWGPSDVYTRGKWVELQEANAKAKAKAKQKYGVSK